MTVDSVEEPGEAEEHRSQEEHPEHHLSWSGAMKYMLGLSMVRIPRKRNSTKPAAGEREESEEKGDRML